MKNNQKLEKQVPWLVTCDDDVIAAFSERNAAVEHADSVERFLSCVNSYCIHKVIKYGSTRAYRTFHNTHKDSKRAFNITLDAMNALHYKSDHHSICMNCDGCGWYEGGETLQTVCEKCEGTGVEKKEIVSKTNTEANSKTNQNNSKKASRTR